MLMIVTHHGRDGPQPHTHYQSDQEPYRIPTIVILLQLSTRRRWCRLRSRGARRGDGGRRIILVVICRRVQRRSAEKGTTVPGRTIRIFIATRTRRQRQRTGALEDAAFTTSRLTVLAVPTDTTHLQ